MLPFIPMVIFIDESGTLADPKDRFVVFAAIVTDNPKVLIKLIPKARKRVPPKKKHKRERLVSEFKFRTVGDNTKIRILKSLAKQDINIFAIVIDKKGRKVGDTPANYALIVATLLKNIAKKMKVDEILIDRHYNQQNKQEDLARELKRLYRRQVSITHTDSLTDSRVDLADFAAGAILKSIRDNIHQFKKLIEPKTVSLKMISWKDLKSGRL